MKHQRGLNPKPLKNLKGQHNITFEIYFNFLKKVIKYDMRDTIHVQLQPKTHSLALKSIYTVWYHILHLANAKPSIFCDTLPYYMGLLSHIPISIFFQTNVADCTVHMGKNTVYVYRTLCALL